MSADADRIAALEAELAEAWRVAEIWLNDERTAHERTKAELADARKDAETFFEMQQRAGEGQCRVARERDAALAEAATMRRKIEYYVEYPDSRCNSDDDGGCVTIRQLYSAIGNAGRAIAARVPLLEAVAKAARIHREQNPNAIAFELSMALAALDEKGGTDAQG